MIKDDPLRLTRLDIETDSMIEQDQVKMMGERQQFLQMSGQFLQQAVPAAEQIPELGELLAEMLMYAIRGARAGRELESTFEAALAKLKNRPPPQPQGPSPDMIKLQTEQTRAQTEQMKQQAQLAKQASDQKIQEMNAQAELQKSQMQLRQTELKFTFDKWLQEENFKLQREELMLKYGVNPFIQAAIAAQDTDAQTGGGEP